MDNNITPFEEKVHKIAKIVLTNAAKKLNDEIKLTKTPVNVFTIENETKLEKEDYSGSNLSVITEVIEVDNLCGGFTTAQTTRTFKTKAGRGYIDSEIVITISQQAIDRDSVNLVGVEKAIKVLTEGYLRSIQVLYRPDTLEI